MKTLLILKPKQSVIWCHLPLQLAPPGMPLAACLLAITVGGGRVHPPVTSAFPWASHHLPKQSPKKVAAAAS